MYKSPNRWTEALSIHPKPKICSALDCKTNWSILLGLYVDWGSLFHLIFNYLTNCDDIYFNTCNINWFEWTSWLLLKFHSQQEHYLGHRYLDNYRGRWAMMKLHSLHILHQRGSFWHYSIYAVFNWGNIHNGFHTTTR